MKDFLNVNNSTMHPQYNISFKKLISDSARNFYDWLFDKCNTLDIQNKVLGNYLVKLHEDYKDTYSFIKKLRSIKSTDEFKNLFPYTSYSDYNNSIHNIIVKQDFVFSKYIFEEYCDIY